MEKVPFESHRLEAGESVMDVRDLRPVEIRFKHDTKEIFVIYEPVAKYGKSALLDMSWQDVRKLVLREGGPKVSKKKGIEYLLEIKL